MKIKLTDCKHLTPFPVEQECGCIQLYALVYDDAINGDSGYYKVVREKKCFEHNVLASGGSSWWNVIYIKNSEIPNIDTYRHKVVATDLYWWRHDIIRATRL